MRPRTYATDSRSASVVAGATTKPGVGSYMSAPPREVVRCLGRDARFGHAHHLRRAGEARGRSRSRSYYAVARVKVTVKLFAALRERAGYGERELEGAERVA